jgi:hypothetical protein
LGGFFHYNLSAYLNLPYADGGISMPLPANRSSMDRIWMQRFPPDYYRAISYIAFIHFVVSGLFTRANLM